MRAEKELLKREIKDQIEESDSFVIMSYKSFSANAANEFRGEVAKLGGGMEMVKKRVLLKAADEAGVTLDPNVLQGHIGLVFAGKDPIPVTKFVCQASSESNEALTVMGGKFDGTLYSAEQVKVLSELPGKDEMRAQFLATLQAPMVQTVTVMNALLTSLLYCLENKSNND